jgi:pantoate kinase
VKIPVSPGYCAVILCIKPINTASLLDKSQLSRKKNFLDGLGREMVHILKQNPRIDTFLELSNRFADEFGLLDGYCKEPFLSLGSIGIQSSVALFGHALFTIVKRQDLQNVIRVLSGFNGKLIVCDIDNSGAKLIDKPYDTQ